MLDTDTKRRIDTARDILVGKVPDPKSQVEQIMYLHGFTDPHMTLDFLCPACGLEGQVSGGPDCGMVVGTTTIYCLTCQTLQDAVVAEELYAIPLKEIAPRCQKRKSHPIKLWNKDEPCPRCGQALLKEDPNGAVIMWD